MADASHVSPSSHPGEGGFATTRWSLVGAAAGQDPDRDALQSLCSLYWYPLYSYVRRQGFRPDQVEDLTQSFFAMLLDRNDLAKANRERGRFRAFLLTAMKHFLLNQLEAERMLKRGGGQTVLSFDFAAAEGRYVSEPMSETTAEDLFQRQWALLQLERAGVALRDEYVTAGQGTLFERLYPLLTGDRLAGHYADAALELGMTEGAVKVAMHRLRQRFGERLRDEILQTVSSPEEVDDEIRELFESLRK